MDGGRDAVCFVRADRDCFAGRLRFSVYVTRKRRAQKSKLVQVNATLAQRAENLAVILLHFGLVNKPGSWERLRIFVDFPPTILVHGILIMRAGRPDEVSGIEQI
jgi:hypothetical protein